MTYLVEFAARAARDLEILYKEKNAAESHAAPEARRAKRKLRHLLYGKKPNVDRVIYEVDEELQTVWVLTIRHGARHSLRL